MKVESLFLLFLGAFFGIVGLIYWFWGYDDGGGIMLLGATLLGFLPGLYYFFWHQRFHGHKYFYWGKVPAAGDRPSDREDAELADGAGNIDSFPGSSIWPFVMGMGAFMTVLALVFGSLADLPRRAADPDRADRRHRREPARRHRLTPARPPRSLTRRQRRTRAAASTGAHGRRDSRVRSSPSSPWPPARWWPTSTTRNPCCTRWPRTFHSGPGPTSAIITATQIGYAAGLLLIVPLGDLHPRRGSSPASSASARSALVGCALAPSLWFFAVASVLVGGASVAGQVMIPFAADLAPEERRGRVVARIMTGLLMGILLARTVSGLVAQAAGWRAIYWLSAGAHGRLRPRAVAGAARRRARARTAATPSSSGRRSACW